MSDQLLLTDDIIDELMGDIHNKIGRSGDLINQHDCSHQHQILLASGRTTAKHSDRYSVFLCTRCGQFKVLASKDDMFRDGIDLDITFNLVTVEAIAAASRFRLLLDADAEYERKGGNE